jgi:hypothetical protein
MLAAILSPMASHKTASGAHTPSRTLARRERQCVTHLCSSPKASIASVPTFGHSRERSFSRIEHNEKLSSHIRRAQDVAYRLSGFALAIEWWGMSTAGGTHIPTSV